MTLKRGLWSAVALIVLVLTQVTPHKVPMGTVLYGVLYGSLNGLLAVGLVLIFRVTRSINFAYGAMGGLPAGIAASLYLSHHTPWAVCVVLAMVLGGLVGAGVGALINWRFSRSPRLVLTVASIGLAQLLGGIALFVPRYFKGPSLITSFRTGLSHWHTEINPVLFNGNDLVVVIAVPVIVLAVTWFLLRTDAGRAVRAIADNADRARLVGVPARRLMVGVWALAGLVAGLAVILQAPSAGVPLDAAAGPAILLPPLAAAVIAGMSSLPAAFGAGVGLGVLESVVRLDISKQSVETPVFLVVILVALLVQHRGESRVDAADEGSWSAAGELRPIAKHLARLPEVRAIRTALWVVLVGLALAMPAFLAPGRLYQVTNGLVFGMAALSLVMLSGWSGTVSLGQMALVGVGAITAGDLMMHLNLDFFLSLFIACLAGAVAAVILGLPALRVRGLYLAVTTLAFAVAANDFFLNPSNFSKQLPASVVKPVLWKRFPLHGQGDLYLLCLGTLVVAIALTRALRSARPGRAILATRDNSRAAEAAAVPSTRTRLMAFALSGLIAGAAGALYVVVLGGVGYQTFQPTDSITVFSMVVIGGISSIAGSLAGVGLIQWIGIEFPKAQIVLTGFGLLVVLMVFPSGLAGLYQRARDALVVSLARRHGIATSVWSDGDDDSMGVGAEADPQRSGGPVRVGAEADLQQDGGPLADGKRAAVSLRASSLRRIATRAALGRADEADADDTTEIPVIANGKSRNGKSAAEESARGSTRADLTAGGGSREGPARPQRSEDGAGGTRARQDPPSVDLRDGREPALLGCAGVDAAYGAMQVLFGVDMGVKEGEILALLGTNGAGKSTLLRTVTGLLPARSGRILFAGTDITHKTTEQIVAAGITMMPGGRGVFSSLTVEDNLRVASWPLRKDPEAAEAARAEAVDLFPVLSERYGVQAGNLSGGEQQMLSLAMAFLGRPRLLCIDELSLGLAPVVVATLLDAVRRIHAQGVTIVIVEQSVNVALLLAERATFLEKGQVRFSGPARSLLDRPDLLRAVFIGGTDEPPKARTRRRRLPKAAYEAEPVLRCQELSKRFGGVKAVDEVDLDVAPGEIVGLIGHNGAGKTTLFDLISGFLRPDRGRIYLDGEEVTDYPAWARSLAGLGRSFQEARLFPSLTVAETIAVAYDRHLGSRDPLAAAFRMPASTDSEARAVERVDELVASFGLDAYRNRAVGDLSTGTRRIVELACVMAHRPSLMMLDEPSGGVAQRETEALGPLLRQVATETGCSMLVIEHDMTLVSSLCDRLIALELGRVIANGPPSEVLSHPEVVASYLGTEPAQVSSSRRRRRSPARV